MRILNFNDQLSEIKATRAAYHLIKDKQIQIYKLNNQNILLHSKLYLITPESDEAKSHAIIGSSNFTASGLGLYGDKSNKELNILCSDSRDIAAAKSYFQAIYAQCAPCTNEVLEALNTGFFYRSPQEIVQKLKSVCDTAPAPTLTQSQSLEQGANAFGLYDFQKSAALELLSRLNRYGTALLADPVGAGKTLTALGVASTYQSVTIITPKNLKAQWESYFLDSSDERIRQMGYQVQILSYHQACNPEPLKAQRLKDSALVVIDECHNFRNGVPRTKSKRQNTYQKLQANLNPASHLLLLSATPINNSIIDLANQLALKSPTITDSHTQATLAPHNICLQAQSMVDKGIEPDSEYFALTHLIFHRSHEQIAAFLRAFEKDLPESIIATHSLSSVPEGMDLSFDYLNEILNVSGAQGGVSFCIYDPYRFLPEAIKEQVSDKQLENLGDYTTPRGFICMNLFKSLESSIDAFKPTLEKIISYYECYLSAHALTADESEDELDSEMSLPTRLSQLCELGYTNYLSDEFEQTAREDLKILRSIAAKLTSYDSKRDFHTSQKFKKLCEIIDHIPDITSQKLLIFTESIPTAKAITASLQAHYPHFSIEAITGELNAKEFASLKARFSPISLKAAPPSEPIDILVATDCLSEGANLQDCANLLNWDIAFNPVRSIQRIGRIWRIGSQHKQNHINHFFPDTDINSYIKLESKLKSKIAAAKSATAIADPHNLTSDTPSYAQSRKAAYDALEHTSIPPQETSPLLSTPQDLLSHIPSIAISNDLLPDGIFSIATNSHHAPSQDSPLPHNHLFALMQDSHSHELYFTLYDMTSRTLYPSATQHKGALNLEKILTLHNQASIDTAAFGSLEELTQDYQDLRLFKETFQNISHQLNTQIHELSLAKETNRTSDGGLFSLEEREFKLLAWLLLNPAASTPAPTPTDINI